MSALGAQPAGAVRRVQVADPLRLALLACWAGLLLVAVVCGERSTSLAQLDGALSTGRVQVVEVSEGLAPGGNDYGTQEVSWRDGLVRRRVEVTLVTGGAQAPTGARDVVHANDVVPRLLQDHPDVEVVQVGARGAWSDMWGWRTSAWVGLGAALVWCCTLGLLVSGAEPWRATRWAWFWVMTTAVGAPAFLLLSGPVLQEPAPR